MKQEEEYIGEPNEVVNPSVVVKEEEHSEEEEEEEEEPEEEEEEQQQQRRFHHQPHTGDGASPGKIFIGGLAKETTPVQFNKHFGKYGEITDSVIMKDRRSGQPRGFGFVTYADPAVVDKVIEETHVINGKQVEIKRTIPKGSAGSKDIKTKKIFVGGIPTSVAEDEFKDFFAKYGEVKEHMIMRDHATNRSRGFGFITFETEESVDDLLSKGNRIDLAGTQVEIKKAEPKKANPPPPPAKRFNDSRPSYGGGFGDSYGGYGGAGAAAGGGYGASSYRSGGGRPGAYGGYGGSEYGGAYGGYGGSGLGGYNRGEPPLGYASRYGGGYGRGYDQGGAYGGAGDGYGGYGGASVGGFGSTGTGTYDTSLGSGYGGGTGGSFYGSRGGYGGGAGRYHPYGR
ncbi:Rna-binding protein [Thalictrum thalictroides]|uniref:Rna-binding protein n=1 Tax=Thalictrum thalictroides TaxID=46969 RepID=A0A7J6X788_THATH|nr:Rna-binding protein [Thalictrum thalictroides]